LLSGDSDHGPFLRYVLLPYLDHSLTNTSYRMEADQEFVRRVYLELANRRIEPPVVPYMDDYCLVPGMDFRNGFLAGLEHSKVAVLFILIQALEKMKNAAIKSDNLLLEVGSGNNYICFQSKAIVAACNSFRKRRKALDPSGVHKTNDTNSVL